MVNLVPCCFTCFLRKDLGKRWDKSLWISKETCFDCVMSVCCSTTHFSHQVKAIARAITLHSCQIKQPLCLQPALRVTSFSGSGCSGHFGFSPPLVLIYDFVISLTEKIRVSRYLMPLHGPKDFSQVVLLKLETSTLSIPHVYLLQKIVNNSHPSSSPMSSGKL